MFCRKQRAEIIIYQNTSENKIHLQEGHFVSELTVVFWYFENTEFPVASQPEAPGVNPSCVQLACSRSQQQNRDPSKVHPDFLPKDSWHRLQTYLKLEAVTEVGSCSHGQRCRLRHYVLQYL